MRSLWLGIVGALLGISLPAAEEGPLPDAFDGIQTIVVIFQENRSYVHLLPNFPGASGVTEAPKSAVLQRDRDGSVLPHLPPLWATDKIAPDSGHVEPPRPDPAYPTSMPNGPFFLGEPPYNTPADILTPIPVHRFYQNQMQINGGRNDMFVAWTNVGSLTMGAYRGEGTHLYKLAREYALADQTFMGAFGGSNLNHFFLACACSPPFPNAPENMRAVLAADGTLKLAEDSPKSALDGPPKWVRDGSVTPDGHVANTVQPAYQPSGIPPAPGGDPKLADPAQNPLPPQTLPTVGDRLSIVPSSPPPARRAKRPTSCGNSPVNSCKSLSDVSPSAACSRCARRASNSWKSRPASTSSATFSHRWRSSRSSANRPT